MSRLALISVPFARQGWYPEVLEGMARVASLAEVMKQAPIYKTHERIAPRPEDTAMRIRSSRTIMVEFFRLPGGGKRDGGLDGAGISSARLAILPGMTHYNLLAAKGLLEMLDEFLK